MRFPHNTHNHVYVINTFVLQARYCVFPIIMLSIPLQPSPWMIHSQHTGASAHCAVPYPGVIVLVNVANERYLVSLTACS